MAKLALKTGKMQGETEQQFFAWLLYCNARSIEDMIQAWELVRTGRWRGDLPDGWREDIERLGTLPTKRQVETWSSKFRWIERKELKLQRDIEELYRRAEKYQANKKFKIAIIFGRIMDGFLKIIESGKFNIESMTMSDFKKIWEMARTEFNENLGRHDIGLIDESEQKPPTPDEDELGKEYDSIEEKFYDERTEKAKT